jgi:selenocysteine lyase/cysteine desulfurase
MPDKFESGSHNAIGIAGLSEGLAWILKKTIAALHDHDRALTKTFLEEVDGVEGLTYYGPQGIKNRMGVFSVRIRDLDPITLSRRLESEFGILTRPGIHCAPHAHATIGTTQFGGTTRLSFGAFLQPNEIRYAADALSTIALETYKHPVAV